MFFIHCSKHLLSGIWGVFAPSLSKFFILPSTWMLQTTLRNLKLVSSQSLEKTRSHIAMRKLSFWEVPYGGTPASAIPTLISHSCLTRYSICIQVSRSPRTSFITVLFGNRRNQPVIRNWKILISYPFRYSQGRPLLSNHEPCHPVLPLPHHHPHPFPSHWLT